jgi:hypothetical protein
MRDYSNQLAPIIERAKRKQIEAARPQVQSTCICRNAGQPDRDGWVSTDPNCIVHRPHRPWIGAQVPRPPSPEERAAVEAAIAAKRAIVVMQQMRKAKRAAALRERAAR